MYPQDHIRRRSPTDGLFDGINLARFMLDFRQLFQTDAMF